jgi:nucleotide-binding universal stress UspA family protein
MMRFQKILFPVDFSTASKAMAPHVREMARLCTAEVAVLHSFDFVRGYNLASRLDPTYAPAPLPVPYMSSVARLREQAEGQLQTFAREEFPGVQYRTIMGDGDPATVIEEVAQRDGIDLIMMPTSGAGTFRRLLLGSATAKILHDVRCAVFTTIHESEAVAQERVSFRAIVCAVDLNEDAEAILRTAGVFAQACGARLSILHMTDRGPLKSGESADGLALEALARKSGAAGAARILHEDVVEGIRRAAIEESADLVIVGRGHDRGTISRLWSDLYRIVRESPCPVLSV